MATSHANSVVEKMNKAGLEFSNSLSEDQKTKACFHYMDGERLFWYYPPINRHGISLRDLDDNQKKLALKLMSTGLTERSYKQALQIIDLESVLGPIEKENANGGPTWFDRNPELYYFRIFGTPGQKDPWGWSAEGHHVSLHYSILGDQVISMTPFFFGANPAEVRQGPKNGLRILSDREDIAYDLMNNFDDGQIKKAIIYDKAPWDILTYNSSKASLPAEEGIPISKMNGTQRNIIESLISEYINQVPEQLAERKFKELREFGLDKVYFAWAGPTKIGEEHYYRIHGGNFVVEFDNRQNGANHIHSVWRDVDNDFAEDVMRKHLLEYHVL
tara:strand:+ start:2557 stop:3549 length:993 start_codon:yes stop_codon:yes gene_type:complete